MRILLITHFFPPHYNAGTENYTLGLAEAFLARGHDIQVLCAEEWESGEKYWNRVAEDIYKGVLVHRIDLNWMKARDANQVLYDSHLVEEWLDQFLTKNQFDVVHVTSAHSLGVGILRSVKRTGTPLVLTLMDFWFICPNAQLLRSDSSLCDGRTTSWQCQSCLMAESHLFKRMQKTPLPQSAQSLMWGSFAHIPLLTRERGMRGMLLNMDERKRVLQESITLPDLILSHSVFLQQMFAQNMSVPIKVLRHGLNLQWRDDFHGKASAGKLRFGYIGQLQWTKGVHVLIEAFQRSQLDGGGSLQIWGDPSRNLDYVKMLQDSINNDQAIKLRGRFEQDQIAAVLAEIDVLVVPSLWYENSPLVIKEAFAVKTPVIATDLGGMAELVTHNVDGLLFEKGDAKDLARQLRRIFDEPGLLDCLQRGIQPVKSIHQEIDELEAVYSDLIARR